MYMYIYMYVHSIRLSSIAKATSSKVVSSYISRDEKNLENEGAILDGKFGWKNREPCFSRNEANHNRTSFDKRSISIRDLIRKNWIFPFRIFGWWNGNGGRFERKRDPYPVFFLVRFRSNTRIRLRIRITRMACEAREE